MRHFFHQIFFISLICLCPFLAEAQANLPIRDIIVKGVERVDQESVLSYAGIDKGETVSDERRDDIVRTLFGTGLFSDVKISQVGTKLIVEVVENPIVNKVAFEGNTEIEDEILDKEIRLKPRKVYTRALLKKDVKFLYDIYRLKGYFTAKVTPEIIRRDQNRVDVIFNIQEGKPTKVRKIIFVGNKNLDERVLLGQIQTEESKWYKFWGGHDSYDADRLAYDQELLRKLYLQHGYVDFQVRSVVTELTPDQRNFFITFTLDEGERFRFGKIDISSSLKNLNADDLKGYISTTEGDWYNSLEIERTISKLTQAIGNKGYAFVEIRPQTEKSDDNKTVSITFDIQEGPRVFIDRIDIAGNFRTNEDVIRRELQLFEGDAYNAHKLERSERRLKNLGFFKKVSITQHPTTAPDKINLRVELEEEESTGELSVGGGFSTSDGFLADLKITERNLMGKGQEGHLAVVAAKRRQEFGFGFTEPYFMGREVSAGFDVFVRQTNKYFDHAFRQRSYGAVFSLGYMLAEDLSQTLNYTIKRDRLTGLTGNASKFVREQAGSVTTSMVSQATVYDRRDNRIEPTTGYFVGFSNDIAGLGGQVRYVGNKVFGGYYYPITESIIFGLRGSAGAMLPLGRSIRIVDRYIIGGDTLRGFDTSGIGPVDKASKMSLGGLRFYTGTAQIQFPLGLPNELGIKGNVFLDAGSLWHVNEPQEEVIETRALRAAAGFGVSWRSPMGPLSIDFAVPLKKQSHDSTQAFRIGFGTRF